MKACKPSKSREEVERELRTAFSFGLGLVEGNSGLLVILPVNRTRRPDEDTREYMDPRNHNIRVPGERTRSAKSGQHAFRGQYQSTKHALINFECWSLYCRNTQSRRMVQISLQGSVSPNRIDKMRTLDMSQLHSAYLAIIGSDKRGRCQTFIPMCEGSNSDHGMRFGISIYHF